LNTISPATRNHNPAVLTLASVSFAVDGREILHNISLEIDAGQIVTLIGPNGAGKTSLIKIAMGLQKPTSGTVHLKPDTRIGYMPQRLHMEPTIPLRVNRFLGLAPGANAGNIRQTLDEVGASHVIDSAVASLSGGELQRVLLARALLRKPGLLVLDEPTQGVDLKGQAELYSLITRIRDRHHCSVLMVSHDLHLVMSSTDEVICLNQHVCCHGHPEQVSNDPVYLEMFGRKGAEAMALYTHHHNHHHDLAGEIVREPKGNG
jgi:zinc transport system ATP-binding protein